MCFDTFAIVQEDSKNTLNAVVGAVCLVSENHIPFLILDLSSLKIQEKQRAPKSQVDSLVFTDDYLPPFDVRQSSK